MEQRDLVNRWQQGDRRAFELLVQQWQQPIARFLFRLTGKTELVQDLCQEVFLRVYHAAKKYQENGNFSAWLYRIALNVARDAGRKRAFPVSLSTEPLCNQRSAETTCQQRELAEIMTQLIAELPENQRIIVNLRHDEGLSFEDIARRTGTPATTWKSRFAVALTHLRERLAELGYGPEDEST